MGAPSSSMLSEVFLQHTHITYLTQKHKITNYFRYVDDILLIFDSNRKDVQNILTDFNISFCLFVCVCVCVCVYNMYLIVLTVYLHNNFMINSTT